MSERGITEAGYLEREGVIDLVTAEVNKDVNDLQTSSPHEHRWSGKFPLTDTSVDGIFAATQNLLHNYVGSTTDPNYPCAFYLVNGNDRLGVRFKPDTEESTIQVVRNINGLTSPFTPIIELARTADGKGEVTALQERGYDETHYETLGAELSSEALSTIAQVVAAARWDLVFRPTSVSSSETLDAKSLVEASFEQRQQQITESQERLDADKAFFSALRQYHGNQLPSTLEMQGRVMDNGVPVAAVSENGETANKYTLIGELLSELVQNVGTVALSDPDVSVQVRIVSDLKRATPVDASEGSRLLQFANQFNAVYNGVNEPVKE